AAGFTRTRTPGRDPARPESGAARPCLVDGSGVRAGGFAGQAARWAGLGLGPQPTELAQAVPGRTHPLAEPATGWHPVAPGRPAVHPGHHHGPGHTAGARGPAPGRRAPTSLAASQPATAARHGEALRGPR